MIKKSIGIRERKNNFKWKSSAARNSATGSFIGDHNVGFISRSSTSVPAQERMDRKGLTDKSRYPIPPQRIETEANTWEIKQNIRDIRCAVARNDVKCD